MIDKIISHYRIISKIGAGGMGEVYLAQDTKLDRKVALKILPAEVASNRDRMDRFVREAKSAAALNHPNIAHVYEIGESNGTHFIAMEFIDGKTLREKIHGDKAPLPKLLKYLIQVTEALSKAHAAGIVHRDLKPDNIMITCDDYAKVLDFGLAKLVEPQRTFGYNESGSSEIATAVMQQPGPPAGQSSSSAQHSTTGMVIGTIGYMSPEQASGRVDEIDHRSDIFSFGCILFEAASGQRAFEGKDVLDSLHKIVHAPTPQLKDANPLAPADLQRVVRRCLAKEPEKRYQSIKELAIELDDLQQELKGFIESEYSGHSAPSTSVTTSGATRVDEGFWVAVLPFNARDADPAVAALADGLSEEIVTGLSRFRYLSVVTSASAARLKGKTEAEGALGAKLGTRYVLEGSIRKGGSAIRVSAQLVDTETGAQLWSETYNRDLQTSTIFAVQDDVAGRIVATVADSYGVLVHSMRAAIWKKDDIDLTPVEWQFQYFAYREQITPSAHAALRNRLKRVVKRNDRQSDMWACIAQIYVDEYAFGFQDDATSLDRALAAGRRAVELDRANQFALVALAQVHFFRQDLAAFSPAAERAMALNPLNTDALGILGLQIVHTGEFERGTAIVRRAMELNPNHAGWMHFAPLWDHFHKGEYEQALECANRVDVPGLFWPFLVMASACGHLGRRTEAEAAVRDLLALDPEFAAHVRSNVGTWHFASGLMDPLLEGLRKAGLEISDEEPAPTSSGPSLASVEARVDEGFWVAVLPFKFTGSNTEVATLAEGLSEEIVTGLSRFSYLRVISRSSALRYASETDDVRAVGKTLGARYVMEGSLRLAGSMLRVAVQLVDASTGAHLWAETYNRPFRAEDIFALQDDLVPRIVSTVADQYGALVHSMSESLRGRSAGQYSAHEAVLRAFGYWERMTPEEHAEVRDILEAAVAVAPDHSDCLAELALIYWHEYAFGYNLRPDPLGRARAAAQRAVASAPTSHFAHCALATGLFFQKDYLAFRAAAERALALNRMDSSTAAILGNMIAYAGDWEYGLGIVERAMQLNPHHAGWYHYVAFCDAYRRRDYRGALASALKVNMPAYHWPHVYLAAVYGQLGERQRASAALRELHALVPNFGAMAREEFGKWLDAELTEHLLDGLRKAGLEISDKEPVSTSLAPAPEKRPGADRVAKPDVAVAIAVLPFSDMSPAKDQDYLCEGMAEEIMNALVRVDGIRVASRTSAFRAQKDAGDLSAIARALSVGHVLEGSVRTAGSRLRVTAQLTDVASGYQLWSERFDREAIDVFAIQDEIAAGVVDAVKARLGPSSQSVHARPQAHNLEAYRSYLKGRHLRGVEDFVGAMSAFEEAVRLDPAHAPSWTGLAEITVLSAHMGMILPRAACTAARKALATAKELQGESAEGVHVEAFVAFLERRWDAMETAWRRALELQPDHVLALGSFGITLCARQKLDEALPLFERARQADPLASFPYTLAGWGLLMSGRPEEGLRQIEDALTFEKEDASAIGALSLANVALARLEEGIAAGERGVTVTRRAPFFLGILGWALAAAGRDSEARMVLEELRARPAGSPTAVSEAWLLGALGEIDDAFEVLARAEEEYQGLLCYTGLPGFDSLRGDPRFGALLVRMGLPPAQPTGALP